MDIIAGCSFANVCSAPLCIEPIACKRRRPPTKKETTSPISITIDIVEFASLMLPSKVFEKCGLFKSNLVANNICENAIMKQDIKHSVACPHVWKPNAAVIITEIKIEEVDIIKQNIILVSIISFGLKGIDFKDNDMYPSLLIFVEQNVFVSVEYSNVTVVHIAKPIGILPINEAVNTLPILAV